MIRAIPAVIASTVLACGSASSDLDPEDAGATPGHDVPLADAGIEPGGQDAGSGSVIGGEPALLVPGAGVSEFIPVSAGDEMDWVRGPQGGVHVFGGLSASPELLERLAVPDWNDVAHGYELENASGDVLAQTWLLGPFGDWVERPDGSFSSWGVLLILRPGYSPRALSGETLTYRVLLESPGGDRLQQTVPVQTRCCL